MPLNALLHNGFCQISIILFPGLIKIEIFYRCPNETIIRLLVAFLSFVVKWCFLLVTFAGQAVVQRFLVNIRRLFPCNQDCILEYRLWKVNFFYFSAVSHHRSGLNFRGFFGSATPIVSGSLPFKFGNISNALEKHIVNVFYACTFGFKNLFLFLRGLRLLSNCLMSGAFFDFDALGFGVVGLGDPALVDGCH